MHPRFLRQIVPVVALVTGFATSATALSCGNDASGFANWKAEFAALAQANGVGQAGLNALLEKCHIIAALIERVTQQAFDKSFCQRHVVGQVKESCLRFDHPELSQMATGIAVFRTKRRTKRVAAAKRSSISFCL